MKIIYTILLVLIYVNSNAQSTVIVRPGQNNVPITEMKFDYNGTTYTQTTEASGTPTSTSLPVSLEHTKINDGGTIKTLDEFNSEGALILNNNFSGSVEGVGVYNQGTSTMASNQTSWDSAMILSGTDNNLLNYLWYDYTANVPSGSDFDIVWTRGWNDSNYLLVGERYGNSCFSLMPIDSAGNVITSADTLQFGNCGGGAYHEYDWNIGFAPSNFSNQSFAYTAVKISKFNSSSTIYGFRIDNTVEGDPKFFGMAEDPFTNNKINPMIPGIVGNVYHDVNGLVNSTVDGIGIDTPSSTTLYANLLDASQNVLSTKTIASDGTYDFLNLPAGNYSVLISTTQGTIGQAAPSAILPTGWVFTGENIGSGSGSDGNANGASASITLTTTAVFDVNFGIEVAPEADNKSQSITTPTHNSTIALTTGNGYPQLSGTDYEGGALGSGNDLEISDTSGMNGNELYYNGIRVELNTVISSFDPALLTVKYSGLSSTDFSFSYYFKDGANIRPSHAATYDINWSNPLPVEWLTFEATVKNDIVQLNWRTASEINNDYFSVEHSTDGQYYEEIGIVEGNGTKQSASTFDFEHFNPVKGVNFYRLKQVDFNGAFDNSQVRIVEFGMNQKSLTLFPNPASDVITIRGLKSDNRHDNTIRVIDITGSVVIEMKQPTYLEQSEISIDISILPKGIYFIASQYAETARFTVSR